MGFVLESCALTCFAVSVSPPREPATVCYTPVSSYSSTPRLAVDVTTPLAIVMMSVSPTRVLPVLATAAVAVGSVKDLIRRAGRLSF